MDARDLDVLLSEVTLMHTRCELYWRFLKRRVGEATSQPPLENGVASNEHAKPEPSLSTSAPASPKLEAEALGFEEQNEEERLAAEAKAKELQKARHKKLDALLNRSVLSTRMQVCSLIYHIIYIVFVTGDIR